jgi:hypothetical protein
MVNENTGLLIPTDSASPLPLFTENNPMSNKAKERTTICPSMLTLNSPFFIRLSKASGIDIPKMNRKEGNTTSLNPSISSSKAACFIQWGVPFTLHRSLTKIIKNMVKARNTSMDAIRTGLVIVLIFVLIVVFYSNTFRKVFSSFPSEFHVFI